MVIKVRKEEDVLFVAKRKEPLVNRRTSRHKTIVPSVIHFYAMGLVLNYTIHAPITINIVITSFTTFDYISEGSVSISTCN